VKVPAHEATTAQLGAVYPCVATHRSPARAVLVGRDLYGGAFVHDPFELYRAGVITNPNIVVLGQIGRGKSAFVKTYLFRQAAFGRRIVVLDPKGEYGPLASALGARSLALRPGGSVRINPLDLADERDPKSEIALVGELASVCLGRPLSPGEHTAVEVGWQTAGRPCTLASVTESILSPDTEAARRAHSTRAELRAEGRPVGLELRRFISGELAGMFGDTTSVGVELSGDVVVFDLSAVYDSDALPVVVTCVAAVLQAAWRRLAGRPTFLVIDEAWAVLQNPIAARFMQASFKLARARGVSNLLVVHRASDFSASGSAGSIARQIAEGLLSDCESVVCYAQAEAEIDSAIRLLGLSSSEARLVARLRRGLALWRVGSRPHLVEHRIAEAERSLVDTDAALQTAETRTP
jgi:type IV secretory pathway VirB4 component